MTYDWEADASAKIRATCGSTGKYKVIGVAVVNNESREACFIDMSEGQKTYDRPAFLSEAMTGVVEAYKAAGADIKKKWEKLA